MEITNVVSKLPWEKSVGRRLLKDINYAIVHHDAALTGDSYDAVSKYVGQAKYHISKGWKHMSYHLRIARDGKVYQTVPFEEIGYHAGSWKHNVTGIGICLDGDLTKQEPTTAQLASLRKLMDFLSNERPDMPKLVREGFWPHKGVRLLPTSCPSPMIAKIVDDYRKGK